MKNFVALLWLLTTCVSCTSDFEQATRIERTAPFEDIRLASVFSVSLIQDTVYSVTTLADVSVLSDIAVSVEDGTLQLHNTNAGSWLDPEKNKVEVIIRAPSFHQLIAEESYSLHTPYGVKVPHFIIINDEKVKITDITLDIECSSLLYWNNWLAGGRLVISGHAQSAELHNYALHVIDASKFEVSHLLFYNNGRENCEIHATARLDYTLNGPGNLLQHGLPSEVNLLEKTSSGQLIIVD